MSLDENDKFTIFGKYTIANGDFNLAYADVVTRTFKLENGSTIAWNGDPFGGILNIRAIHTAKVNISNIVGKEMESSTFSPNIPVNNIIRLSGNILKPDFVFTFNLPEVNEKTRYLVYDKVDTTNREEMIKQMVNILFLGQFQSSENAAGTGSLGNNLLSHSISELVSHQLNRVVSGLIPNLDVHINYNQGGVEGEKREYGVDLGSSFFNNKLTVRTSFGLVEANTANVDNQFLGDVQAEYKLSEAWKLKGFNVTNQQDLQLYNAKYSQGIGLSYSTDFDRFKDLFVRKKRKTKQ
jgi:hypothetical protein